MVYMLHYISLVISIYHNIFMNLLGKMKMFDSNNNMFVIIAIVTLVIGGLVGYIVLGSDTEEKIVEVEKTEEVDNFLYINGAGASFPFPLVSNMIEKYFETHDLSLIHI